MDEKNVQPITPEFNAPYEPYQPPMAQDFHAAAMAQQQQEAQLEMHRQSLEAQRAEPEVQGMNYTYGGETEQTVHTSVVDQREQEIAELTRRLDRGQGIQRTPEPEGSREAEINNLAGRFARSNSLKR
jgi:hypothetical protein